MMGWKKHLGVALLGLACAQAWAATLSVQATPASVNPGASVSVAVNITDVADLAGYGFALSYDASILRFTGFSGGAFLGSGGADTDQGIIGSGANGIIDYAYGTIVGDLSGVSGNGTLGWFTFESLIAGTSALTLSDVSLASSIADADGFPTAIVPTVVNGSLTVLADTPPVDPPIDPPVGDVPEPASLALLGIGALAVGAMRRRRTAVAA